MAALDNSRTITFRIQLSSPRKEGKPANSSYLHAFECASYPHDKRSNASTRICVHDNLYGDRSEFILTPAVGDHYRIQLKGSRLDGGAPMPSLYVSEGAGDMRDEGSTYVSVHDNKHSLWRFIYLGNQKYRIQLIGSRKENGKPGPFLHVCEVYDLDRRDEGSTRVCVHDNLYGDTSEFSIY